MRFEYDEVASALYVYLEDKPYAYGTDLDHERRIDYAADGTPIGLELSCVRSGVNVDSLPSGPEIVKILRELDIPLYA